MATAGEARRRLAQHASGRPVDIVITDISMPDEDGIRLMTWAREHAPGPSWLVLTGRATVDVAVRALKLGAVDFFTKPLDGDEGLVDRIRTELAHRRIVAERDRLHAALEQSNAELRDNVGQLEAACGLLADQAETLRADLRRAALIQHALLPQIVSRLDSMRVSALYRPSQNVGGDLYDVVRLNDHCLSLLIADAAGHGLSAAMLAVLFRNRLTLVDDETGAPCRPRDALRRINRELAEGVDAPGLFITAACCLVDLDSGRLQFASGGHPPAILHRAGRAVERLMHTGPALGLYADASFTELDVALEPGDRLLLYTDGLYDRMEVGACPDDDIAAVVEGAGADGIELLLGLFDPAQSEEAGEDDVTLVLLENAPGRSVLDNGTLATAPPPKARSASRVEFLCGEEADRTVLCIRGRADWQHSAAFHERCAAAIDASRQVILDLTLCSHLDSTFLGTIHELSERAEQTDAEFRIQGVMPPVEELLDELGMTTVLERVLPSLLPLPRHMAPIAGSKLDERAQVLRLLQAHEGLAELNERNLREFDPLVERLRRELKSLKPAATES